MAKLIDQIYNPSALGKDKLIQSFVVRLKTFESIWKDIKEAEMKTPEQCILIEGQRGMGKTTLLLRLSYELENDKALNSWLLPVVFNEEEYGINRLYKMWLRVAEILAIHYPDVFTGLYDTMDNLYPDAFPDGRNKAEELYEKQIFEVLESRLKKENKKIILFIDNLATLFGKFTEHELRRLRGVLITSAEIRIIAGTVGLSEEFLDYKAPFYEFFKIKRLKGLDRKEAENLLIMLGDTLSPNPIPNLLKKYPNRIETLRRLTGGVTRTLVMLFEFLATENPSSAFKDLEKILDRTTPLYKHRMDDLPAQQQIIVEAIALAWDGIGVKEIVKDTRLESKVISAQLTSLVENGIIDATKPPETKNYFYQLSERFFNIWYLMRFGGKSDKQKVKWLTRFYESLLDQESLNSRIQNLPELLKTANTTDGDYLFKQYIALTEIKGVSKDEKLTVYRTLNEYFQESGHPQLVEKTETYLHELNKEIAQEEQELLEKAYQYHQENNIPKAEEIWKQLCKKGYSEAIYNLAFLYHTQNQLEKAEKYYLIAVEKGDSIAIFNIALLYQNQNQTERAEKYYLMATEKGDSRAMNNLGNLYYDQNQTEKAEKYYLMAIEKGDSEAMFNLALLYESQNQTEKVEKYYLMAMEKRHSRAIFNLALLYESQNQTEKAEKYYLMAIERGDSGAIFNLALLYKTQNQTEKAEKYYLMAIEKEDSRAMNNLAFLYQIQNQPQEAEKYYLMAIEKGMSEAMFNLGVFYDNQTQIEKAEKYYLMAVEKGYSGAMFNIAILYENQNQTESTEKYYLMAIEKGYSKAMFNLAFFYNTRNEHHKAEIYFLMAVEKGDSEAMFNLALLYHDQNQTEKAEKYYLMAIEKGYSEAIYNLAFLYHTQNQLEKAEKYYLMAIEKGDSKAIFNLALLYSNQDRPEKAEKYYLMAIEKGDSGAMNNLALLYHNQNQPERAKKYYLMAIEKGYSQAIFNLALLYHNQNQPEKAEKYYLMAIEKGDSGAMNNLALLYHTQNQIEKAEKYYLLAIGMGVSKAVNNLAWIYYQQNKPEKIKDLLPEMEKITEKSPELSHTFACVYLAVGEYEKSLAEAENGFWYMQADAEGWEDEYTEYILLLLAKKQYDTALYLFKNEKAEKLQLKDRFKPLYYAVLYFLKDKYLADYLRMGSDLEETVMELVERVNVLVQK